MGNARESRGVSGALHQPGLLTEQQIRVIEAAGNFFLVACPGSGKTRTGGVRFATLVSAGRRVAAMSYTNVGIEQIRSIVTGELDTAVPATSFVGTLHAFLLRYVFYPFAHLVMGCTHRPRLIADDGAWDQVIFGGDNRIRASVGYFRFLPDGSLCFRGKLPRGVPSRDEAARIEQARAMRMKRRYARVGFASLDDSMFWALEVLRKHPAVANAVAGRFHELQVDEAQDTSELQLACLHELCATGRLDSLVLIGDIEQSIYSFQGASPEHCRALTDARRLETIELSENHRSSQRICDVTVHFCARTVPDRAVGATADCPWAPELFLYHPKHPEEAVSWFSDRLATLEIEDNDAFVLARGHALVDELNGQDPPVKCDVRPLALGRAAAAVRGAGTLRRRQMEAVDRVLAFTAWDTNDLGELDPDKRRDLRSVSMMLLKALPPLDGDLRAWVRAAGREVDKHTAKLVETPKHKAGHVIRSSSDQEGAVAADAFAPPPDRLRAQTVHDVKGESRDAVLVVGDRGSRGRDPQGALWSRPLLGEEVPPEQAEELRIVFVALTRARRLCAVALPSDTSAEIGASFEEKGFVRADVERD